MPPPRSILFDAASETYASISHLTHKVHLVSRTVVPPALQPAGLAGVTSEVVPCRGVELVVEEVVSRQRFRLQGHTFADKEAETERTMGTGARVH